MKSRLVLALGLLLACAPGADGVSVDAIVLDGDSGPVVVHELANAGVWIQSGSTVVVVDGLYEGTLSGETYRYANLSSVEADSARAARGRWGDVDLVLTTHRHFDHFDAGTVAGHLRANDDAHFAGPRQASELLLAEGIEAERVHGFRPGTEGTGVLEHAGVTVRFLDLPHGGSWRGEIENVGIVVELDGTRVLHVGDAATDLDLYAAVREQIARLDLFLVPVWFFDDPSGARVIRDTAAAHVIGMHASPERNRALERFLANEWPTARLFWREGR